MKNILVLFFLSSFLFAQSGQMSANDIMKAIDKNLNAESRIVTSKMVVRGRRNSRTIESKNWVVGTELAFTEYLSPPREAGTKMLKLGEKLYTYSPQTDRVIQISGHMLRQSVMGSDMSYNDMMEDRPLEEIYKATISGSETFENRDHWVITMEAKARGLPYPKRKYKSRKEYVIMEEITRMIENPHYNNNNRRTKKVRRDIRRSMYKKTEKKGFVETIMGYFSL